MIMRNPPTRPALVLILLALASTAFGADGYARLCPNELKELIFQGKKHVIVDVQTPDDFAAHNFENSLPTAGESDKVSAIAAANRTGDWPVIIVGKAGGEEEERAGALLVDEGVAQTRVLILEGGMDEAVKGAACGCCRVPEGSK